jgi:hypothetical protein
MVLLIARHYVLIATDGVEVYDGINKNLHITSNGNINTNGILKFTGNNYSTINAISFLIK